MCFNSFKKTLSVPGQIQQKRINKIVNWSKTQRKKVVYAGMCYKVST